MSAGWKNTALAAIEGGCALLPHRPPSPAAAARARIVSHRGERDNVHVRENTFAAFDALVATGVWGIEFDVRWTRDLEPVVCHDPDLRRVFRLPDRLNALSFAALRARCPAVPHLDELLQRYAGRFHLMLELKSEPYPRPERQRTRLLRCLAGLTPGEDFHVLALETGLFAHVADLPAAAHLPVARLNVGDMSSYALDNGCAGVAGPFFALGRRRIARHAARGQRVGVGFPEHRGTLYQALTRGAEWVFSNRAAAAQEWLGAARGNARGQR